MDILKWKFKTKIAILTPKLQFDVKIIDQTQISTIQDHSKLIYLSHNSLFLPLRSSQNINFCTGPPCISSCMFINFSNFFHSVRRSSILYHYFIDQSTICSS